MTTYDKKSESYTTSVAVSMVIPVHVYGTAYAVQAEHDAVKAVKAMMGSKLEGMDVSAGEWPIYPFVELAQPTSIEVERL